MTPPGRRPAYECSFVLAYDLPSENLTDIRRAEHKNRIEVVRSTATQLFHRLGVQTTESVILISPEHEKEVKDAIETVLHMYESLERDLRKEGEDLDLDPLIRIIGLSSAQTRAYKDLAIRYIERKATESANYLERVTDRLEELKSAKTIARTLKNLERHRKGWEEIQRMASELELSNDWDIPRIIDQIDRVIARTEKELG